MRKRNSYSRIIQSVADWGEKNKNFEKGKMINLLHYCIEQDITSFDSADFSGNTIGRTFGTALSESGLGRDNLQLISKYRSSASAKGLAQTVNDVLLTLRTDYLDLLLLEFPEQPKNLLEEIEMLSSQGKILEVGGLDLQKSQIDSFSKMLPVRANQLKVNFSSSEEKETLETLKSTSEEITQMIILDPDAASTTPERNRIYAELTSKYGITGDQLLTSWILQHPAHLHPVISFGDEAKIKEIVAAKEVPLDPADWQKLNLLLS